MSNFLEVISEHEKAYCLFGSIKLLTVRYEKVCVYGKNDELIASVDDCTNIDSISKQMNGTTLSYSD